MFSHVATLLSFVYALCLTHVLASAGELLLARDRVVFSGLQAVWMLNAAVIALFNWLAMWTLKDLETWSIGWIASLVAVAIIQFFICSLVSVKPREEGPVDMGAFYDRQRPMFIGGFLTLGVTSMVINALDPSLQSPAAFGLRNWVLQDLAILPINGLMLLALLARSRWLQWLAALGMLGSIIGFAAMFAPAR
ncbi:MAG: hypothetical protein K1X35_08645 [Caulobacteraceae bacterium]|nr:hypothetical protein [Caulobacteraceae bacterium]